MVWGSIIRILLKFIYALGNWSSFLNALCCNFGSDISRFCAIIRKILKLKLKKVFQCQNIIRFEHKSPSQFYF